MIARTLFKEEHDAFRDSYRRFLAKEVLPCHAQWETQGFVDRQVWLEAGTNGFLCTSMPESLGGAGADKRFEIIVMEENARVNATGLGFSLHSEIVAPYLLHYGTPAQHERYLPAMARGEKIGAIAMTEPGAGSDLQGIRSSAIDKGDHFLLNGSKTFITNGWHADLVIVVAKTDPAAGAKGTSLLIVERGMPGFERGRRLQKVGMKAQDTSELFFDNVQVPKANLLGRENQGFAHLMQQLPWERLHIAIVATASALGAIETTLAYVRERKVFGQSVGAFQNTRFKLAEMATEAQIAQVFVDRCTELLLEDKLDSTSASMAKAWCSEMQGRVLDQCVQLHGGYGFMWEYQVARAWADARVQRIYGGTTEIMWELVARSIGLPGR